MKPLFIFIALSLLPIGVQAVPVRTVLAQTNVSAETVSVPLQFDAPAGTRTVNVAGQFNGWNRSANPMQREGAGDHWTVTLQLSPGIYEYKFVVNGETWVLDPKAPSRSDGNGNTNSLLMVTPADYQEQPGIKGDGKITRSGLIHTLTSRSIKRLDATHIGLVLITRHNDVQRCAVWTVEKSGPGRKLSMVLYKSDLLFDYWRVTVPLKDKSRLVYRFHVEDGKNAVLLGAQGVVQKGQNAAFQLVLSDFPPLIIPGWIQDAVFYQIFPDRFENGSTANDPKDVVPWGSAPTGMNRMGGDLQGVQKRLPYLKSLGINALYFNPIFFSRSNHGYDTNDYNLVDPRFGTSAALKTLTASSHKLGWHVILDGVFNHTSIDFPQFRSLREQGEASPYKDWYFIQRFPLEVKDGQDTYTGWFANPWMPKLNTANPATRRYLLDVAQRWIVKEGIDGWRLDAADEVSHDYWKQFRSVVKRAKPDAYIVGEIWGDASAWLAGDQFDGVMNYRWRSAALDFFAAGKLKPSEFDARLRQIRDDYPPAATFAMLNILDSHDTERVRNSSHGDWNLQRQAVLFQMTYPGAPCVYYGDEIGLPGGNDPDDRRAFPWNASAWNQKTLTFYRQVIWLRQNQAVLRRGSYRTLLADDARDLFVYERELGASRAVILLNRSSKPQQVRLTRKDIGAGTWKDWLKRGVTFRIASDGTLIVPLAPFGIAVLGHN